MHQEELVIISKELPETSRLLKTFKLVKEQYLKKMTLIQAL